MASSCFQGIWTTGIWLICSIFLAKSTQLSHPQSTLKSINSTHDGGAVPGDSPVRYNGDPAISLFAIDWLDMYPNPCVIDSYCGVKIWGTFGQNLTAAHLSFNITTHFDDGRKGHVRGEDDFMHWADVIQNDTLQSEPTKGKAVITSTTILLGGWIPEANYTVKVGVTADQGTVLDLWTQFEMKIKS
ncbi:MAG: hypothetical protein ASARMPREDX12_006737 [Alectoria sarmentosa]|nr:MAG: hypothetical protein ASARMPREDX12_006737 [Alectoria sarmentosa]